MKSVRWMSRNGGGTRAMVGDRPFITIIPSLTGRGFLVYSHLPGDRTEPTHVPDLDAGHRLAKDLLDQFLKDVS